MEILKAVVISGGTVWAIYFVMSKFFNWLEIRDDRHAADRNNYKIIKKSNGKYYAIRKSKSVAFVTYERVLYGDTLEKANESLDDKVEFYKEQLAERHATKEVVWKGNNIK